MAKEKFEMRVRTMIQKQKCKNGEKNRDPNRTNSKNIKEKLENSM